MFYSNTTFCIEAREEINRFKRVWRQNKINFTQNGLDLNTLKIKRKDIKHYTDIELYHAIITLITQIENIISNPNQKLCGHKGLNSFLKRMQSLTQDYRIQNNQIFHKGKYASELLLSILQDIQKPATSDNNAKIGIVEKIKAFTKLNHSPSLRILKNSLESLRVQNTTLYRSIASFL